jgi:hypothetical protein
MTDAPSHRKQRGPAKRGKRKRAKKLKRDSTLAVVNRLLLAPVRTSLNGRQVKITALEAIVYQLLRAEAAGDVRASAVLLKYMGLAKRDSGKRPLIVFADSDYSQSVASYQPSNSDG